ncbi:hypothetical protein CS063_06235 [Sporanaerobium hydrogeniformans]|uniref:Uncharacterized protein n=1 Tax=Sporanaerobium hydrogeniformans TaxID=3072179 RepID=A0AC61DF01_9FIRM|nr:phosphodiester glycosidase family protein [Sporanaerobium hydrogeniformans]PHV71286.1 hypothetical protein CS063_06235 [Sporanaerobium hydrogeniformans]
MRCKKLVTYLLVGMIGVGQITPLQASILYKKTETQTVTKGATLTKEAVLTEAGWLDLYLLKANLFDENIALRPIESPVLGERQTVLQMVQNSGAVAGVNADFFGLVGNTPSFGPVVEEGEIKHAYHNGLVTDVGPGVNMGTFLIDNKENILLNYFSMGITLYADGQWLSSIRAYNKVGSTLSAPVIIDNTYLKNTLSIVTKFVGACTIVVENDRVVRQVGMGEAVDIPQDGYVILMDSSYYNKLKGSMAVGSIVEVKKDFYLNNEIATSVSDVKMAVGGGGLIMKGGEAYKGSTNVVSPNAKNPRTIVATTKKAGEVLLIGIDGRGASIGVTHNELINLLKGYGVQDAMYLDGGGSTTVVARSEGETTATVQNKPSEGALRKVVNGVGIFTTQPLGSLNELYIELERTCTFVEEPISFKVRGTDSNKNPVSLDTNQVVYSVTGIEGVFENNTFTPLTAGKGLIIADYQGIQVATEVQVHEAPVGLVVEPSKLQIDENSSKSVKVYGVDVEGYKIPISASKLHWETNNGAVQGVGNTISVTNKAIALLRAEYGNVSSEVEVIGGASVILGDSFEESGAKWGGDTSTVTGKVEHSKEVKYHGTQSIKMTYNLAKTNNRQTAFMSLMKPITVPTDAATINLWLYASNQKDAVKLQVEDSKGRKYYLKVSDSLTHNGWKYFSVPLPQGMQLPAKITRVYTVAPKVAEKRTSAIYVDHVSFTRGSRKTQGITLYDHYKFDPLYRSDLSGIEAGQQTLNIIGPTAINTLTLEESTKKTIGKELSKETNLVVQASNKNSELPITASLYSYRNKLETLDMNATKIMMVGSDSGSIRLTDSSAWAKMTKQINETSAKNIILITRVNPLTQFNDTREGMALHDVLKSKSEKDGTNIFVIFTGGNESEVRMEDGIRYIRLNGFESTTDNINDAMYLRFKIIGEDIYYTFNKLIK